MTGEHPHPRLTTHKLARLALLGFIITFVIARAMVFLIMSHQVPNMYCFLNGTHVHHLNYGIFLLAAVGGYSVLHRPAGRTAEVAALIYGFALALTFDEFGMWLHLGGSYWQRASVDAIILVAAVLSLLAYARSIHTLESHHFWGFALVVLVMIGFGWVVYSAGSRLGELVGPTLQSLELSSSP